jgi:hypothetical protein
MDQFELTFICSKSQFVGVIFLDLYVVKAPEEVTTADELSQLKLLQ